LLSATNINEIITTITATSPKFDLLVVDSIQTMFSPDIGSAPGTVSQVKAAAHELINLAKQHNIILILVGHVTKEGQLAGPKILEHMVDTVIYFEGDQFGQYRILRAMKNRFGNTNEVGIFEMKEHGLQEVKNPSQFFLDDHLGGSFGRTLTCIVEGSRSIFVEIQALVVENKFGNGRRTTQGLESNRLAMMVAVVEKYFALPLGFNDIYLNIVGGIKLQSRESDLSIIASLLSSYRMKSIDSGTVFVGEVGLTGEVRSVPMMEMRIKEMAQLNYKRVVTSLKTAKDLEGKFNINLIGIKEAKDLEKFL
jgi:DNA repair protein RadA/Sms